MFRNLLLKIKYDGSEFCGWQRQPQAQTVQGEVEKTLSVLCAEDIKINGTSRTDAGVHALEQCASFKGEFSIPTANIKRAVNNMINPAIQILDVIEVPDKFHARFNCEIKTYIYKIVNSRDKDPFQRNYVYTVDRKLDFVAMEKASRYFKGTHDFASFQAAGGEERETTVRTIEDIKIHVLEDTQNWKKKDDRDFPPQKITVEVTGDGFLYNMVRIVVGTLVDVGMGKLGPESIEEIIKSKDRQRAGHTAPPQGLYLKKIYFGEEWGI